MKTIYNSFLNSSKELKKVRNLVLASLLITIQLLLSLVTRIYILPTIRISFDFLASAMIGMLFGPSVGALCGAVSDIINYIMNPQGGFFPGFTLTAVVLGIIYGLTLYNKKITLQRCMMTVILTTIICDMGLNTLWLAIMYNKAFTVLFVSRTLKSLILLPINVVLMYVVLKYLEKIKSRYIDM